MSSSWEQSANVMIIRIIMLIFLYYLFSFGCIVASRFVFPGCAGKAQWKRHDPDTSETDSEPLFHLFCTKDIKHDAHFLPFPLDEHRGQEEVRNDPFRHDTILLNSWMRLRDHERKLWHLPLRNKRVTWTWSLNRFPELCQYANEAARRERRQ